MYRKAGRVLLLVPCGLIDDGGGKPIIIAQAFQRGCARREGVGTLFADAQNMAGEEAYVILTF